MTDGAFVGLEVSRTGIHVAVQPTGEQWSSGGDDAGISEATQRLNGLAPELVVMEALGGLELPVAGNLATAGLPLAMVSPRSTREFARAIGGVRGDRNQAMLLAYFAELVRPEARRLPSELIEQLTALKLRRQELLNMLDAERTRPGVDTLLVQKDIRNHIQFLEKSVICIGEEINRTVRSSWLWR
jgi:transposase